MKRFLIHKLREWRQSKIRKPIILRGARQVGKTHLVESFGKEFKYFVTINFEKQPSANAIFAGDLDPKKLIRDIELFTDKKIIPGETLLFLDEIQEMPRALIALRYFYEECPELHVIATGSLLDFAIEKVGVPVGRVSYLHLYPMSFIEFLMAMGRDILANAILDIKNLSALNPANHNQLLEYVAEYIAIGGMPEVIKTWRDTQNIDECGEVQSYIIQSYQQDFEKYVQKHQLKYVSLIFQNVPHQLGRRFKFAGLPGGYRKRELAPCYELLTKAKIIKSIYHSDGQGVPLAAQVDHDYFKSLFIDVALAQRILGYHPKHWFLSPNKTFVNKGEIVESFIGQELLAYNTPSEAAQLFYWQRHEKSSSAEVDYLIHEDSTVLPIEVKSGAGTSLKSMRIFLGSHSASSYGIRFSTNLYSEYDGIHSYPLYAVAALMAKNNPLVLENL